MTTRPRLWMTAIGLLLLGGCANRSGTRTPAERETLSGAACTEKGGRVVGDIGDGAIHRPDYRCVSGVPPIADIRPSQGEPVAIEGSVCCPETA